MQNYETESAANFPPNSNNQHRTVSELMVTPDNPPWNNWIALGLWAASIIFIIIFPNVFLFPYLMKQNLDLTNQDVLMNFVKTDSTAILLQVISIIPAHICTIVLAWFIVTKGRKYSFRQTLGWEWNGFKVWHSIVIVIAFLAFAALLGKVLGESENDFQKMLENSRMAVFPVAFMATFTAPLIEEVVYRGVLYSSLQRKLGVVLAVVVVTLLFGLVHVPQYSNNWIPDFSALIPLFLLSLTLTLIRVRTKNLLPCILVHTVFNAVGSMALILEPYFRQAAQQHQAPAFFNLIN